MIVLRQGHGGPGQLRIKDRISIGEQEPLPPGFLHPQSSGMAFSRPVRRTRFVFNKSDTIILRGVFLQYRQ